jgi:hypothetical protein
MAPHTRRSKQGASGEAASGGDDGCTVVAYSKGPSLAGALNFFFFYSTWVVGISIPMLTVAALAHSRAAALAAAAAYAVYITARMLRPQRGQWLWFRKFVCSDTAPYTRTHRMVFDGFEDLPMDGKRFLGFHPHGVLTFGWTNANSTEKMRQCGGARRPGVSSRGVMV